MTIAAYFGLAGPDLEALFASSDAKSSKLERTRR